MFAFFRMIPLWSYLTIAALLSVGVAFGYGYFKGHNNAVAQTAQTALKGIKKHEKVSRKVMQLPDHDLDKRLSKWMRD